MDEQNNQLSNTYSLQVVLEEFQLIEKAERDLDSELDLDSYLNLLL